MRLTLEQHQVREIAWGSRTKLDLGVLTVDRDELVAELLRDERLTSADLDLASPGEACRMVQLFDVVEPRARLEPAGADFPGILSPVQACGNGRTRVLRGAAVAVLDPTAPSAQLGRGLQAGHVLDMAPEVLLTQPRTGFSRRLPSTDVSLYAGLRHVVVVPRIAAGVSPDGASQALRVASLRAAVYLAAHAGGGPPDDQQVLELGPAPPDLPRVAYVYQLHSHQIPTLPGEPLLYGDNCRRLLPTLLHPNEVLDGAVVRSYYQLNMETYGIQNNAIILDLYRRHGRELNFVGVVVNVANQMAEERERCTTMSANLVRWILKADGAVFSKTIGGAPHVDMALVAERCEELGVKTAMLVSIAGEGQDSALFNSPALDAIVSAATVGTVALEPTERVIAGSPALAEVAQGAMTVGAGRFVGSVDHLGAGRLTSARY
ncbi:MAG TPA: glycine/sarcosine/betaine reductase component B subunit [Chloroflexota bacterium]|nr:glycine/sarcosine/betaine reductase component B subunit [Chloroflexota bacterium]